MKQLLSLLLITGSSCIYAQNNSDKVPGPAEPFKITFKQIGIRIPQRFFEYVLTDRKLEVKRVSTFMDSTYKADSKTDIVFTKELPVSDKLKEISHISINDFEQIKKQMEPGCNGGIVNDIKLQKYNKECQLIYSCAKSFDIYTKQIVKFINKQVSDKYEIRL